MSAGVELGFRRRCAWCGVQLRWWQLNLCRRCGVCVRLNAPGPWTGSASRWDDVPDRVAKM